MSEEVESRIQERVGSIPASEANTKILHCFGLEHNLAQGPELERFVDGIMQYNNSKLFLFSEQDPKLSGEKIIQKQRDAAISLRNSFDTLKQRYGDRIEIIHADDQDLLDLFNATHIVGSNMIDAVKSDQRIQMKDPAATNALNDFSLAVLYAVQLLTIERSRVMYEKTTAAAKNDPSAMFVIVAGFAHITDIVNSTAIFNEKREKGIAWNMVKANDPVTDGQKEEEAILSNVFDGIFQIVGRGPFEEFMNDYKKARSTFVDDSEKRRCVQSRELNEFVSKELLKLLAKIREKATNAEASEFALRSRDTGTVRNYA